MDGKKSGAPKSRGSSQAKMPKPALMHGQPPMLSDPAIVQTSRPMLPSGQRPMMQYQPLDGIAVGGIGRIMPQLHARDHPMPMQQPPRTTIQMHGQGGGGGRQMSGGGRSYGSYGDRDHRGSRHQPPMLSASAGMGSRSGSAQMYEESDRNLIINYLPPTMNEGELGSLFSPYGAMENIKIVIDIPSGRSRGFGFVKYMSAESARNAMQALNGFQVNGKRLKVAYARPQCREIQNSNLYVTNVPMHWSKNDLKRIFQAFGGIIEVRILTSDDSKSRGVAFVRMDSHENAMRAIRGLDKHKPRGCDRELIVKLAQRRSQRQKMQQQSPHHGGHSGGHSGGHERRRGGGSYQPHPRSQQVPQFAGSGGGGGGRPGKQARMFNPSGGHHGGGGGGRQRQSHGFVRQDMGDYMGPYSRESLKPPSGTEKQSSKPPLYGTGSGKTVPFQFSNTGADDDADSPPKSKSKPAAGKAADAGKTSTAKKTDVKPAGAESGAAPATTKAAGAMATKGVVAAPKDGSKSSAGADSQSDTAGLKTTTTTTTTMDGTTIVSTEMLTGFVPQKPEMKPSQTVGVTLSNLPSDYSVEALISLCSPFGPIQSVNIQKKTRKKSETDGGEAGAAATEKKESADDDKDKAGQEASAEASTKTSDDAEKKKGETAGEEAVVIGTVSCFFLQDAQSMVSTLNHKQVGKNEISAELTSP